MLELRNRVIVEPADRGKRRRVADCRSFIHVAGIRWTCFDVSGESAIAAPSDSWRTCSGSSV